MKKTKTLLTSIAASAVMIGMGPAAQAQSIELEVASWKGNEAEPAGLPEIIARYEEQNPDITVQLNYLARGEVDKVVTPRIMAGSPPSVVMADPALMIQWSQAGALADLGADSAFVSQMMPDVKSVMNRDGSYYVQPLELTGLGNFVNAGLLEEAGIEAPPATLAELADACAKLNEAGIGPMVFGGYSGRLLLTANALDGNEVEPTSYLDGTQTFAQDESFAAGLDAIRAVVDAECFDPELMAGVNPWSTGLQAFMSEQYAMFIQGSWNIGRFAQVEGLDVVFTPIPTAEAPGAALLGLGPGWAIPEASPHPEAARKWLDFFMEPEILGLFLADEQAASPYSTIESGMAASASAFVDALETNAINDPTKTTLWPGAFEDEIENSVVSFLLNMEMENSELLGRWDAFLAELN